MSAIAWRMAGPQDADILSRLGRETFTETFGHLYSEANLSAFLEGHEPACWRRELADPRFRVRIGEAEEGPAAFAKLGPLNLPFRVEAPAIELRQFYVLKPWHGTGAARELMAWALGEARSQGAEELYLSVFVDNARARRFYESHGFEYVGRYHFMVGTHADDDLIMRLRLE